MRALFTVFVALFLCLSLSFFSSCSALITTSALIPGGRYRSDVVTLPLPPNTHEVILYNKDPKNPNPSSRRAVKQFHFDPSDTRQYLRIKRNSEWFRCVWCG